MSWSEPSLLFLTLSLFGALPPVTAGAGGPQSAAFSDQTVPAPTISRAPVFSWMGREGDGWDFSATIIAGKAGEGEAEYLYTANRRPETGARSGTLAVAYFGRHLKAVLRGAGGMPLRGYDGTVSPDRRFVWGAAWNFSTAGTAQERRIIWWATLEDRPSVSPPPRLDLNAATVQEFEAAGLSPAAARTLVEGRMITGEPYRSVSEVLDAPGLNEKEIKLLREKAYVR